MCTVYSVKKISKSNASAIHPMWLETDSVSRKYPYISLNFLFWIIASWSNIGRGNAFWGTAYTLPIDSRWWSCYCTWGNLDLKTRFEYFRGRLIQIALLSLFNFFGALLCFCFICEHEWHFTLAEPMFITDHCREWHKFWSASCLSQV